MVASPVPPTGDLAHNPGMCPDWESNLPPFGFQAGTQSTEPHQPGLIRVFLMHTNMTAVTIQSNKITLNEVKDNQMLLEPLYGENQMNFLANPISNREQ